MTTPVSSPNCSFYDPNAQFSPVGGTAQTSASTENQAQREVTLAPVVVTGDAGAQQLLKQHDAARRAPDCSQEGRDAVLSCAKAGIAAAGGALITTTVVAAGVAGAATLVEAMSCGKDLRTYYDCKTQ